MISEDKFSTVFKCRQCGQCCKGFGGTYISDDDIKKIADYIKCGSDTFIEKFCVRSGSKFVLTQNKNDMCIFFDEIEQCTIHPVKPYMCRAWPFIATIIKNPENWNAMASSCPGMQKDVHYDILKKVVTIEKEKLDRSYK